MHPKTGGKGNLPHTTWQISSSRCWLKIPSWNYAYPQRPWWETFLSVLWYPTRNDTVFISHEICWVGAGWPDCSSDLLELIADEYDIAHVLTLVAATNTQQIFKYSKNKIFLIVNIGRPFCKIKPYFPSLLVSAKQCWKFKRPPKYYKSIERCPHLAISVQTTTQQKASVKIASMNIIFSSEATLSTNFNWMLLSSASKRPDT